MSEFSYKLPDLGEGIVESEIVEWHIQVGDIVDQDQLIADIQTDKAVVEATTPVSGKVLKLGCNAGELLAVGSELVLFETSPSKKDKTPEPTQETAVEKNSEASDTKPQQKSCDASLADSNITIQDPSADSNILTSPSVRLRARQNNIDLHEVEGHGPKGRINHQDLDGFLSGERTNPQNQAVAKPPSKTKLNTEPNTESKTSNTGNEDEVKRYPLKGTRRIIAKKLKQAVQTIPHYSYVEEVDVTPLEKLREQLNQKRSSDQSKLTLLPFIIQALVKSLPQFPHCNAHFDNDNNEVTEFKAIHVGIATMTDSGLMVPVIKNSEQKGLWQCAKEIENLSIAARNKTLVTEQLSGSTITITSLGKLGGIASTPIINAPETCIMGINKIQKKPVVIDDAIAIHSVMNISASFDHRIVDGFDGASLIQAVKALLENPLKLTDQ